MLKLFLLLLFSFFAADIHSKESYCPNSIHVEALLSTNFELDQRGLAKKCIDGFEKIYGDPWLYFEDLNIEHFRESSYSQKVLGQMFVFDKKKDRFII